MPFKTNVSDRPWGNFVQYTENENCTVKIIKVFPMQRLSVQRHKNRDELWIALDPGLIATINGTAHRLVPGMGHELWIERGSIHTVENRGYDPARFLEICFGDFDEEDIERLEDRYGRK